MTRIRSLHLTITPVMLVMAVAAALVLTFSTGGTPTVHAAGGGPVILMGIDGDDVGHPAASNYKSLVDVMLTNVSNGGSNILVIGGNKSGTDSVTTFWNLIASQSGMTPTYVNGATAITAQSFAGFALVAVVSDALNTFGGGLTDAENTALSGRSADIATHVNAGGGLIGFSSCGSSDPYGYLGSVGAVACSSASYDDITPTTAGTAAGVTDALDSAPELWHDVYDTFPSFLQILATDNGIGGSGGTGKPSVLGGSSVTIVLPTATPTAAPIPGVGIWGLVGLGAAMLVLGPVYLRRRSSTRA